MTEFEEQKQIYYQNMYQQGYFGGRNFKKPQCQYKPVDVFSLFFPC